MSNQIAETASVLSAAKLRQSLSASGPLGKSEYPCETCMYSGYINLEWNQPHVAEMLTLPNLVKLLSTTELETRFAA